MSVFDFKECVNGCFLVGAPWIICHLCLCMFGGTLKDVCFEEKNSVKTDLFDQQNTKEACINA